MTGCGKTPARARGTARPAGAAWGVGAPRSARVGFGAQPRLGDGHYGIRLPEYSSICVVRSCGYEIVTSVIAPAASRTGSSRGWTKPL